MNTRPTTDSLKLDRDGHLHYGGPAFKRVPEDPRALGKRAGKNLVHDGRGGHFEYASAKE